MLPRISDGEVQMELPC